jgi:outer membrane protein insertion porin family
MVKSKLTFASKYLFQTYSVSFSEPWFGGKNQYHLVHHCHSKQFLNNFQTQRADKTKVLTL